MKFIHIADVHLGAEPDAGYAYTKGRAKELWDTFEQVIDICEEEQTDLLLIAGDLFHRQPFLRELKEADYLFSTLSHTQVVLIAGNHDYIRKDSYYRTFAWSENVYPLFGREMEYVEFPELQTAVYGFSYYAKEIREARYEEAAAHRIQPFEILLAHGGDEKHIPIRWEELERSGFSYVALGHIHKPAEIRKNHIAYAGALEPIDRNDTGEHGFIRGEIDSRGTRTQWVPFARRSYLRLTVTVDENQTSGSLARELKRAVDENGTENLYRVTLRGSRDADVVFDTDYMDAYGNILEILDETHPHYDFDRLEQENAGNLLGEYIRMFRHCLPDEETVLRGGGHPTVERTDVTGAYPASEGLDSVLPDGEPETIEYLALCEGVEAILANRK